MTRNEGLTAMDRGRIQVGPTVAPALLPTHPVRRRSRAGVVAIGAMALLPLGCGHHAPPRVGVRPAPAAPSAAPGAASDAASDAAPGTLSSTVAAGDSGATQHSARPRADTAVSHEQVTEQALRVFGDSTGASVAIGDSASATDSASAHGPPDAAAGPTWDIDVRSYATQARVEYFVARFTGQARDVFTSWLQRGSRYEPVIRAKLRTAGLPEDMAYLPLIESGYSPHAYSRAAAVGLWQLMTSTAQGAGLRVDWWIDERRDPVRSTDAAIRFLKYLKDQFGSIYLAAAAYDGGPGRISRGLARYAGDFEGTSGDDLFFALADKKYLRTETKDYVPQLIAAALVAKEPARYGLHVDSLPPYSYETVRVGASTPLAAIARACGTSLASITDLNPHILRGVTPPRDSFAVRVPVGKAAGFDSAYAALPLETRQAYARVVTRKGDTYSAIARRAGLSARQVSWYNPRLRPSKSGRLPAGVTVLVPSTAVVRAALDVPDPSIERYGSGGRQIHIVTRGESLGRIALRYHTTVASIMRLNGLRKSIILPGQALVVAGAPAARHRHRRG